MPRGKTKSSTAQLNQNLISPRSLDIENILLNRQSLLKMTQSDIEFEVMRAQAKNIFLDAIAPITVQLSASMLIAMTFALSALHMKLTKPDVWEALNPTNPGVDHQTRILLSIFILVCWVNEPTAILMIGLAIGMFLYGTGRVFDNVECILINQKHYLNQLREIKLFINNHCKENPNHKNLPLRAILGDTFSSKLRNQILKENPKLEMMSTFELESELHQTLVKLESFDKSRIPITLGLAMLQLVLMFATAALHFRLTQPAEWESYRNWAQTKTPSYAGQAMLHVINLAFYLMFKTENYLAQIIVLTTFALMVNKFLHRMNEKKDQRSYYTDTIKNLIWERSLGTVTKSEFEMHHKPKK